MREELHFERRVFKISDIFSPITLSFAKMWAVISCWRPKDDETDINTHCKSKLSPSQQFFLKGYKLYEKEICIESILRSIKKLESGVSALIGNNNNLIEASKLMYYSNTINYPSKDIADQCRVTNKYFEFLHMDYA